MAMGAVVRQVKNSSTLCPLEAAELLATDLLRLGRATATAPEPGEHQ